MTKSKSPLTFTIWFGYLVFVIYGSLVPLDFKALPIEQAWANFQQVQILVLGVESRADWIANGVLYVPVGFLTAHLLIQTLAEARRLPLYFLSGLFSITLAFGVEFTQIFFPPRTVSLNDLLAESVGALIGLVLAARYSDWFKFSLLAMFSNHGHFALRLLGAYLVGYIAFSFFPYDIMLSGAEFEQKLSGDNWGWLIAGDSGTRIVTVLKSVSEMVLTLPFGLYLGYRSVRRPVTYKKALLWGVLLGASIEIAQLFTASGVSQGLSVLTRIAGVCGGLALWDRRADWSSERLAGLVQRYSLPLAVIYLLAILQVNGWFSHRWNGIGDATAQFCKLHFLPFYYHYFTTEAKALVSLTLVCLMYFPIGILTWSRGGSPLQAFIYTFCTAGFVETGKLFVQGLHADPTNIVLGALASWGALHLARGLSETASVPANHSVNDIAVLPALHSRQRIAQHRTQLDRLSPVTGQAPRNFAPYVMLLPSLAFAAYWAAKFPTQPVLLCIFLATCAAIIWIRPVLFVAIIAAALPVLDLAPWSGRFFLDEFDLLVLICLAIGHCRIPPMPLGKSHPDITFALICSLVAISFGISTMHGLLPWQTLDANAFTNYYSPFNALRIAKGGLWAFLCYRLLRRLVAAGVNVQWPFTWGVVIGLFLTVGVVFWERLAFSGLFNFTSDYRITGPFSAMHTGGAYIECFLAIAAPFLVILVLQSRSWIVRISGTVLLLAATYALMVTFSRNGYSAFGVALAIILFFAIFNSGRWKQRSIIVVALAGAILAVALPIFTGQFAQDRIATVGKDYMVRQAHWEDALNIRSPELLTTMFGMGLGRYPESHYLLSREASHSGTYQFISEGQENFLRLVSGSSIYVEQLVDVQFQRKYILKLDARANRPKATITITICEKWLLASYNCIWNSFDVGDDAEAWHHFEVKIKADQFDFSHWYTRRPIKFSLYNGNNNAIIEVDNVRLETFEGENLLQNGDFSQELDHWFFSSDSHLQWHIKSMPVAILFDQGWFGLIALSIFSILAIKRATGRAWRGDFHAAAALGGFSSFLVVGLFDTLIDAPRFLLLFLMLGWFCGFRNFADFKERLNGEKYQDCANSLGRMKHV